MSKWPMVPLGEVLSKSDELTDILPDQTYKEVTVRLWGKGVALRREAAGGEIAATRRFSVKSGQFILSRIDARNGALGLVPEELDGAVVSNDFPVFNTDQCRLMPEFLNWLSKTSGFVDLCRAASEGTTNRVRLKESRFLQMEIPLPSLSEQQRIVEWIDAVATRVEEAQRLRKACEQEVASLFSRAAAVVFESHDWPTRSLETLLIEDSRNGLGARPSDSPPGTPILRISAGTSRPDASVDEEDYKYLEISAKEREAYRLRKGDLLACRFNGNLHYVGRFSVFRQRQPEIRVYPDKLIRFRVDTSIVLPEFVCQAMNSPAGRRAIEVFCKTTAGNIGISAKVLKTIPVPVPSLTVQESVVRHLTELQGKIAQARHPATENAKELDALLPSVLNQAFNGGD